jgi:hypothetical protein
MSRVHMDVVLNKEAGGRIREEMCGSARESPEHQIAPFIEYQKRLTYSERAAEESARFPA